MLSDRGTLVIVGGEGGGRWMGGFQRQILAPLRSSFGKQELRALMSVARQENLLALNQLIEAGKVSPVVDKTYPLSQAADAIRYLEQGHARGKVVLSVA